MRRSVLLPLSLATLFAGVSPSYSAGTFVVFTGYYQRTTARPVASTETFQATHPGTGYTLKLVNGDEGAHFTRVTSAAVSLNGKPVVGPSDFNSNLAFLEREVRLEQTNRLTVELAGAPGSGFEIVIEGKDNDRPVIQATATPTADPYGWNNSNVTVSFVCSDAISGIASCSGPVTVSSEGANQAVTGTAVDKAGNTATVNVNVSLDKSSPDILPSASPAPNTAGWNNTDVTVSFGCNDALSGIADCSSPVQKTTQGAAQATIGTATDKAGNAKKAGMMVNLDKTPPALSIASPPPTVSTSALTLTGTASDGLSGLSSVTCNGAGASVSGSAFSCALVLSEGPNTISVSASDRAGNQTTSSISVTLRTVVPDNDPPVIQATATPSANSYGWNNSNVTVSFACSDAISGIASCSDPVTVSSEGANQAVTGTAVDKAGNTGTTTVNVSLDKSSPDILPTVSPAPNAAGWNNTDVMVSFACNDALSGVANCSSPVQKTTQGAAQTIIGTAVDKAGNVKTATVSVNLDKTPPAMSIVSPPPTVSSSGLTLTGTASDGLSGVSGVTCNGVSASVSGNAFSCALNLSEGSNTINVSAFDAAGNQTTSSISVTLRTVVPDNDPPVIQATATPSANSYGWNNSNVTVSFACSDAISGIASCSDPVTVSSEGANQAVTGTAVDKAGNTGTTTVNVSLDKSSPDILPTVSPAPNAAGWNNTDVMVSFACNDALSGVANCSSPVQKTTQGAAQTIIGTAVDKAGNVKTATVSVNLDKTPPAMSIVSPPPTVSSSGLTLTGTASDGLSGVSGVTCNGVGASVSGSAFSCALNLAEGSNTINVSAVDAAGNQTMSSVSVNLTTFVPPPFGPAAVSWINAVGVATPGNSLTKTNASSAWNSGADSAQVLRDGYGFVEFTATETNTARMAGLGVADSNQDYTDLDWGVLLRSDSSLAIYESGVYRGEFGSYAAGDRFRVEVRYGVVRYYRNGALFFTSPVTVRYPTRVDTSLFTPGATLSDVRVGNFVWTDGTGVRISGESLVKTGAAGWNAGAVSTNTIESGDGYLEFTASETNTQRVGGLGNLVTGVAVADIQFGVLLNSDGTVEVVEGGASRGVFGGYVTGDRFRVELVNGVVRYFRNNIQLYMSLQIPTYPLRADSALNTPGATLTDVSLEPIVWAAAQSVYTDGALLIKTSTDGWTSTSSSTNNLQSGDGYVEFTALETNSRRGLGLKTAGSAQSLQQIDFAIALNETGIVEVVELGNSRGPFGSYQNGDRFRIDIQNGIVRYLRNDVLMYSSAVSPAYPLHVETALYSQGATLFDVAMGDLVWMNSVNTRVQGRTLLKTSTSATWNAGAVSTRTITSGYMEFTASEASTYRIAGLSNGDSNQDYTDIDFAILLRSDTTIGIYEAGAYKGDFGTYVAGDRLRVEVQGTVVRYWKNGTLFYTSLNHPSGALRIDTSLNAWSASLFNIVLH